MILNLFLLAIIAVCGFLITNTKCSSSVKTNSQEVPVVIDGVSPIPDGVELYKAKPIELEWMTLEEKNSIGIDTSTESRIQVLKRDASGKAQDYRIIKGDKQILKEY
ncbi:MAG: hypothetical protein WCN88_00015 [Candidatus Falkowbacteria bacterium]